MSASSPPSVRAGRESGCAKSSLVRRPSAAPFHVRYQSTVARCAVGCVVEFREGESQQRRGDDRSHAGGTSSLNRNHSAMPSTGSPSSTDRGFPPSPHATRREGARPSVSPAPRGSAVPIGRQRVPGCGVRSATNQGTGRPLNNDIKPSRCGGIGSCLRTRRRSCSGRPPSVLLARQLTGFTRFVWCGRR